MELVCNTNDLPIRSALIVWAEFIELAGTSPESVTELVEMGWLQPTRTAEAVLIFCEQDVHRTRKLVRLAVDFELSTLGASIMVDLLERIAELEEQVRRLSRSL